MFAGILAEEIDIYWDKILPFVELPFHNHRFVQYYSMIFIKEGLKNRDFQCWIGEENGRLALVVITQIIIYPSCRVFDINFVGGENIAPVFNEGWEILKKYGKENGCKYIRGFGRKGWTRKIPEKPKYHVLWDIEI